MSTTSSEETAPGTFIINGYKYTPKTYTFTITDEASTEAVKPTRTVTTGPEISYAGAAESGHFAFGQSFTGWVYLEPGTEFAVGADDTGSVTVAGLTASAPPGQHAFQWGESVVFNGESGWYEATASHTTVGGPYQFAVSGLTFYEREEIDPTDPGTYPGEETCECTQNCDMGSSPENRSICFSQPFGRTPFATGVLPGKLFLKKHLPDADIYTPAALAYRHYLTRSVTNVNPEAQSATISADGLWENTYTEGVPADNNAWKRSSISVADNGSVTEKLSDNSEISYDENGVFSSVKSPDGVVLTASQLAVEVIRDGSGTLRQIWSLADGLLNIVVIDENSYEIRWYKPDSISEKTGGLYTPTGSPVKVFVCGKPDDENGNLSFEITEKRGADFSFKTRWNYVPENQAWTMIRGETTSVRAWTRDENGRYAITETRTSGTQTKTFTESVDPQH
ncbi:MAG: hypothetical protein IJW39_00255, partial [Opitutales bacterium]|nr:hypothetical protein [Opitutales bacterium]